MTTLSPSEMVKYDWRADVFVKKLKDKTPFELNTGQKVILINNKKLVSIMKNRDQAAMRELRIADTEGNIYKLSDFKKNSEFGGKGEGSGTIKEDRQLASLRKQINDAKKKEGLASIPIRVGPILYHVFDVLTTPGVPKSDFHLIDVDGKEIVWISHKDGSTAKDFQQWGGISARVEPDIYRHAETQKFINDVKNISNNIMPRATTWARKIKSTKLKNMSIYGNKYGGSLGRQNVSLLLQGDVKLSKQGSSYRLTAKNVHINGANMTGDFAPVFMAVYKGDRSNFGVKGARFSIQPIGSRKITDWI